MKYIAPEVELVEFDIIDVIQTSGDPDDSKPGIDFDDNELPKT